MEWKMDIYRWIEDKGFSHKILSKNFEKQLSNLEEFVSKSLLKQAISLLENL